MNKTQSVTIFGGGSLMMPLLVVFIALKIANVIDWPWLWVLAPLWLPLAIVLGFLAILAAGGLLVLLVGLGIAAILDRR